MNIILHVTAKEKLLNFAKFSDFYLIYLCLCYEFLLYFFRRAHYFLCVGFEPSAYCEEY
jgi:hypothetical protein